MRRPVRLDVADRSHQPLHVLPERTQRYIARRAQELSYSPRGVVVVHCESLTRLGSVTYGADAPLLSQHPVVLFGRDSVPRSKVGISTLRISAGADTAFPLRKS